MHGAAGSSGRREIKPDVKPSRIEDPGGDEYDRQELQSEFHPCTKRRLSRHS